MVPGAESNRWSDILVLLLNLQCPNRGTLTRTLMGILFELESQCASMHKLGVKN